MLSSSCSIILSMKTAQPNYAKHKQRHAADICILLHLKVVTNIFP